ncbi:hypothetical protein DQ04_05421030 [Trypanosoma grayi]|uniref:hypothetical protein n=1 Tax=Trypanosoma grayi TaxID=71804 RepID=UPI0004F42819|nr:hypothetical protein DQ04_05421030 [Trypanosoma grayi]KEG09320.1 hypothetical protein DQ04_05421030 [Trypanosoma grayi]
MQQKVLIVTPIALFEVADGKTIERGNCACAVVALPAERPRYSLVCYNDRRETLCVASLSSSNEHSIQFELQVSMYASFRDSAGKRWSCMFLKSSQVDAFLAVLGIALYALAGQPPHTTVISDFAPPVGEVRVGLQHRVKVRYAAFAIRKGEVLQLGELLETNGDRPYNFQPVQSVMALHPEAKGFESSVLGMMEDTWRTVVVPATLPRAGRHLYGDDSVAFVIQVVRILHDDAPMTDSTKVPAVFANDPNGSALVPAAVAPVSSMQSADANGTKIVVLHTERREPAVGSDGLHVHASVAGSEGSGVPAEHMSLIQKIGAQVNNVTTEARDVRDVAVSVAGVWRQSVNQPHPSVLTNAALEQAVKQLIMDNEGVMEDIARRDELIRALDQRNRELQKRVDSAAMVSQQLLDEKNDSVRSASDTKLEKERVIMKLQEQTNQAALERDDTQRHLQSVKKLLEVSDEELRQIRSKADVHHIQAQSIVTKLDTVQDALAEERSRRKGLEAKVMALQEEISNTEADLHLKTAQLDDIRRMADMERAHHAQIMEDERQRRGFEAQQLRTEIITELQSREKKFQADRARVAEDNFKRGQAEGKEIGKREARIDVETQMGELRLDAQRALTELDASKTELRRATETGMAQNRTLSAKVVELKRQMYEETRKRVRLEFHLLGVRTKVRCAQDSVMAAFTSAAYRLRRPAEAADLLQLLETLRKRQALDFNFEDRAHTAEEADARKRRLNWTEEEMTARYISGLENIYSAWAEPLLVEHEKTVAGVRRLWLERDGVSHYELDAAETRGRFEIGQQLETFFDDAKNFFEEQMRQRHGLLIEAERNCADLLAEYSEILSAFNTWRMGEMQAQQQLDEACMVARVAVEEEEAYAFRCLLREALAGMTAVDQIALMEMEEEARAAIDADQYAEFSGLLFDCRMGLEPLVRTAAAAAEQRICMTEEAESRTSIMAEEEHEIGVIFREQVPPPLLQHRQDEHPKASATLSLPPPQAVPVDDGTDARSSGDAPTVPAGPEGGAAPVGQEPQLQEQRARSGRIEQIRVDSDNKDISGNNSSSDRPPVASVANIPTRSKVPPPPLPTSTTRPALFDSSTEDDSDHAFKPKPLLQGSAALRRMLPPKSKLFDSSDSD